VYEVWSHTKGCIRDCSDVRPIHHRVLSFPSDGCLWQQIKCADGSCKSSYESCPEPEKDIDQGKVVYQLPPNHASYIVHILY
jgi:hypothetical protein